jgi:hypothetical protein
VRLLKLNEMRDVSLEEIQRAAERFARQQPSNPRAHSYVRPASYLAYVAKKWLRFLGWLKPPSVRRARFADQLEDFAQYMASEQGLSPHSIQSNSWKASKFLTWFGERHRSLARVNLNHVDEFLAMKGANGWNPGLGDSIVSQLNQPTKKIAGTFPLAVFGRVTKVRSFSPRELVTQSYSTVACSKCSRDGVACATTDKDGKTTEPGRNTCVLITASPPCGIGRRLDKKVSKAAVSRSKKEGLTVLCMNPSAQI